MYYYSRIKKKRIWFVSPFTSYVSEWYVDFNVSGGTDRDGWQYAADFPASYHGYKTIKDFVRRRRWKMQNRDKWTVAGGPSHFAERDVSICPGRVTRDDDHVALWAISNKGDVLCRLGVTKGTPSGSSWLHIGTDQPFSSLSVGGCLQVWAIARDGSAFYRGSVSSSQPAGDCWYHIPSPPKQKLQQVSVGQTSVFAVDENGNLWFRHGTTPSYPQGSTWEYVSNNIRKVSAGPLDQIWVIADKVQGSHSLSCGTVCHRLGVQPMALKGQSWDYGIGLWSTYDVNYRPLSSFSVGELAPPPTGQCAHCVSILVRVIRPSDSALTRINT
ncbi:unnamed protein product [Ranitomeya imitator]|uniref:Peroxin/Ferlin domain-containing protein n=1 Tax=Ranitomeya imitator TaxID=111125 RepID=A0ABN9LD93_9NEOB|nr:unnamed protein product [Ranitomeya imitator]